MINCEYKETHYYCPHAPGTCDFPTPAPQLLDAEKKTHDLEAVIAAHHEKIDFCSDEDGHVLPHKNGVKNCLTPYIIAAYRAGELSGAERMNEAMALEKLEVSFEGSQAAAVNYNLAITEAAERGEEELRKIREEV